MAEAEGSSARWNVRARCAQCETEREHAVDLDLTPQSTPDQAAEAAKEALAKVHDPCAKCGGTEWVTAKVRWD